MVAAVMEALKPTSATSATYPAPLRWNASTGLPWSRRLLRPYTVCPALNRMLPARRNPVTLAVPARAAFVEAKRPEFLRASR